MEVWLVRAGSRGEFEHEALGKGRMGIGFDLRTSLAGAGSVDDVKAIYSREHPHSPRTYVDRTAHQMFNFSRIPAGSWVVMPLKRKPYAMAGRAAGCYRYRGGAREFRHQMDVSWRRGVPKSSFPDRMRNWLRDRRTVALSKEPDAGAIIGRLVSGSP
ncbi:MAG: hypothetical protein MPI95_06285 [Nitrosopumilus sp.]|nr:hypothetical protein [Nitrosopumilus sp.]MDA7943116.1 hypothetical protein [Nitrosopumilus sp.]MDA7953595.1 hypothetical protein [Nitrosopumilus sp.]MDA7958677.1 hypothetical protein [Nitrosopumilus sp.]